MKIMLTFLGLLLLMVSFGVGRQQQYASESCGFAVQGEPAQPTVQGPDDIVPLVYVVEQPDSPIEVVSVDLTGMWLSVANEQTTIKNCAKYQIRNRSDRTVQKSEIMLMLSTADGAGGGSGVPGVLTSSSLAPGQIVEINFATVADMGVPQTITYGCLFTWTKLISKIVITNHPSEFRAASRCVPRGRLSLVSLLTY